MLHSLFRAGLAMCLFGLLLVPGTAFAQGQAVRHVRDGAGSFKQDAIAEANAVIDKIHDKHHKVLFIETVKEGPEKAEQAKWSQERFHDYKFDGVYVVFCKQPQFFRIEVSKKTRDDKYFTADNVREVEKIITGSKNRDEMLKQIAEYTLETMDKHPAKKKADVPVVAPKEDLAQRPPPAPVVQHAAPDTGIPPWVGWVCIGVAVLAGIWVIFAIIRAITGMMGGGGGGGYGYGGGGMMGGGGGGLFTGMLGGLFGAMAGMWIYNNMFGGHASYGADGGVNWGGGNQGGASGGGGDWGGGDGAADAGGGKGGDDDADGGGKGGDGDAGGGGGGDWGGGGDDAGGGGGGDDAGGGGGDWGGGGDAGGGGGGGDWGGGGGGGDFGGGGGGGCGGGGGGE